MLDIRIFEESTKRAAYKRQTEAAEKQGISNCPLCALGNNANKTRIYKLSEMDADHVTAWSKGGFVKPITVQREIGKMYYFERVKSINSLKI